jgi:hypothetical protein
MKHCHALVVTQAQFSQDLEAMSSLTHLEMNSSDDVSPHMVEQLQARGCKVI